MNTAHTRPDTPGWQLLVNLATDFTSDKSSRETPRLLSLNLEMRKNEKIPDDHFDETMEAVFAAVLQSVNNARDVEFPPFVMEFFDTQMGREDFTEMAGRLASEWEVVDKGPVAPGYTLYTKDLERMRQYVGRRDRPFGHAFDVGDIFEHLLGFRPGHNLVANENGGGSAEEPSSKLGEEAPNSVN